MRVWADTFFETLPEGDYWFTVSFEGSLDESVFVVPRTVLGQTETGEAKIYNPSTGWQPLLDPGSQTQQGVCFCKYFFGSGGGMFLVDYSNIYRDGELIETNYQDDEFVDTNASYGAHSYSVENVLGYSKSCMQTIDVRPIPDFGGLDDYCIPINDETMVNHIVWPSRPYRRKHQHP